METLSQLEREGLPSDKQMKQLKKIGPSAMVPGFYKGSLKWSSKVCTMVSAIY